MSPTSDLANPAGPYARMLNEALPRVAIAANVGYRSAMSTPVFLRRRQDQLGTQATDWRRAEGQVAAVEARKLNHD